MSNDEIKELYYSLCPPIPAEEGVEKTSVYIPDYVKKLQQENKSAYEKNMNKNRSRRIDFLIENMTTDDPQIKSWIYDQIWNEIAGFVKREIARRPGSESYNDDLINVAAETVFRALPHFSSSKGTLTTYLTYYLKGAINNYISQEKTKASAHHSGIISKVEIAIKKLEMDDIKDPTITDIVNRTKLSYSQVETALANIQFINALSLDDPNTQIKTDYYPDPIESTIKQEQRNIISRAISLLPPIDRKILIMRFDLNDEYGKELSISAIAKKLKLQTTYVNNSLQSSLRKLKNNKELRDYYLGFENRGKGGVIKRIRTTLLNDFFDDSFYDDDNVDGLMDFSSATTQDKESDKNEFIQW